MLQWYYSSVTVILQRCLKTNVRVGSATYRK
jgi:hypothetical protein